jgi:prepilin-type N-terminal cleavage/methylation domain-containing protein
MSPFRPQTPASAAPHVLRLAAPKRSGGGFTSYVLRCTSCASSSSGSTIPRFHDSTIQPFGAFTLLELLVVISIIGLLAGLAVPVVNNFKPNVVAGASQQLLDDVGRARQLAISQRTTVYMVFVPTNIWNDTAFQNLDGVNKTRATNLFDKQMVAYNFVSTRSLGDQVGRPTARYLSSWKTLPEGVYIAPEKFGPRALINPLPTLNIFTNDINGNSWLDLRVLGFSTTNNIPFPAEDTPLGSSGVYVTVPYIAFNYLGQLTSGRDELIPLTKGAVQFSRDAANRGIPTGAMTVRESPPGNTTNAFNVVSIDWLTGRAHIERPQVQ